MGIEPHEMLINYYVRILSTYKSLIIPLYQINEVAEIKYYQRKYKNSNDESND